MKPKTNSLATVVALTTCGAALAQGGDVRVEEATSSSSLRARYDVELVGERLSAENEAVTPKESKQQTSIATAEEQTTHRRHLISNSNNFAPGCGPSSGTYHSVYLGCYDDRRDDRAFPTKLQGTRHGALDCERECSRNGFQYFGRQFKGQCFCGSDYNQIVRHGTETGCNCCGENVGAGKMCVWENTNHSDSHATAPVVAPILPQPATPEPSAPMPHSHLFAPSGHTDSLPAASTTNIFDEAPATEPAQGVTHGGNSHSIFSSSKPTKSFRLRLYWQRGYNWQDSSSERWWCAQCTGNCSSGSRLQLGKCSSTNRQKWLAVGDSIVFAPNPSLCMTASGFGSGNPIRLQRCNGGRDQKFSGVKEAGRFELQPVSALGVRCVSQHHHPKVSKLHTNINFFHMILNVV